MMVFDDESKPVSRYLKRISTDDLPEAFTSLPHVDGLAINNRLFNEVDRHFTYAHNHNGGPDYTFFLPAEDPLAPLLTPSVMQREIFSHKNGRFSDWWYASLYDDYLVFYSPYDPSCEKPPMKAWQRYEQIWPEHEELEEAYEILEEAGDVEAAPRA